MNSSNNSICPKCQKPLTTLVDDRSSRSSFACIDPSCSFIYYVKFSQAKEIISSCILYKNHYLSLKENKIKINKRMDYHIIYESNVPNLDPFNAEQIIKFMDLILFYS